MVKRIAWLGLCLLFVGQMLAQTPHVMQLYLPPAARHEVG